MKYLIFVLLFPGYCIAQYESFQIENGALIWQKVYETEQSAEKIISHFKNSSLFEEIKTETESSIGGLLSVQEVDCKAAGYKPMQTPMYCSRADIAGFAVIEIKEGKYRVTIKNIESVANTSGLSKIGDREELDDYAYNFKKTKWRKSFVSPAAIYEYTFDQLFTVPEVKDDNW